MEGVVRREERGGKKMGGKEKLGEGGGSQREFLRKREKIVGGNFGEKFKWPVVRSRGGERRSGWVRVGGGEKRRERRERKKIINKNIKI